jgi:predicted NAD/FAD-dependent oxidoreductase
MCAAMRLIPALSAASLVSLRAHALNIAVIGGGIAGLRCGQRLAEKHEVTVYDTGRLRPGGRCSSRNAGDRPNKHGNMCTETSLLSRYNMDHAAQIVTVPKGEEFTDFATQVERWKSDGLLIRFPTGSLFKISPSNIQSIHSENQYYSPTGMASIPANLQQTAFRDCADSFTIRQDVWVAPSNGLRYMYQEKNWKLVAASKDLGRYDRVIIAHNGKCADRIVSKTPCSQIHSLLRVNFAPSVSNTATRTTLNSIYSLTFAVRKGSTFILDRLGSNFMCATIEEHTDLSFITCQTNKLEQACQDHDVFTIFSSAKFAKKYKAPQEFLPDDVVSEVSEKLLVALANLFGSNKSIVPLDARLQLWGAAVPINTFVNRKGYLYDCQFGLGVCGDWLVDSSIAGAWTSGQRLAEYILNEKATTIGVIGLNGSFRPSIAAKTGLGSFDMNISGENNQ